jgi:integrase/recombinase XerD
LIESFYVRKPTIARHFKAPLFRERDQFLESLLVYGANRRHIKATASRLLHVVGLMELSEPRMVSEPEIERAASEWSKDEEYHAFRSAGAESSYTLSLTAKRFFRFHGLLAHPEPCRPAFNEVLAHFLDDLRDVKGRSPGTLQSYSKRLSRFLDWLGRRHELLENTTLLDVDSFLEEQRAGGSKPSTINNYCVALQVFFRHLNSRGIFAQNYARGIQGSALGKPSHLLQGPSWRDVQRLLKEPQAPTRGEIRDRAILLLLSIYGLRASEVSNLVLNDFDWLNETFTVRRVKRGAIQQFPIQYEVGAAIVKYLKVVRPACSCRHLFVTRYAPFRRVDPTALRPMLSRKLDALSIPSEHRGPHALRHACATQLLHRGFSLRDIADFLGHRGISSVGIYAKHDMRSLRQVAAFRMAAVR